MNLKLYFVYHNFILDEGGNPSPIATQEELPSFDGENCKFFS